jgi:hypothetical protein
MQDILAHLLVVVNNGKTYYCRIFICCLMLYALSDEIVNADFFSFSDVKSSETSSVAGYVSVNDFGAIADAKKVNGKWVGTDNSVAFNKALKSCRKSGLTLFIPKGNYGVASTIWLTNPDIDGLAQSSVTVVGSNRGAYTKQGNCAKICVLENFNKGTLINVKKEDGSNIRDRFIFKEFQ